MAIEKQPLQRRVEELYARLQSGALLPSDMIPLSEVDFPNYADIIGEYREQRGLFEERFAHFIPTFDVFRIFDDPSSVVLDVGAHLGYSAIAMRRQGCAGKIVAIDALPSNVRCLARLKEIEGEKYDFIHRAIGDTAAPLRLYLPVMNGVGITGIASTGGTLSHDFAFILAEQAKSYPSVAADGEDDPRICLVEIEGGRLDDLFAARGELEKIVAIKMDLEGNEGPAVRGAERIFTFARPLLMVEGANRDPIVREAMRRYGYFHCERHDGTLRAHPEISDAQDGFWLHPDRVEQYRAQGLFEGATPTL